MKRNKRSTQEFSKRENTFSFPNLSPSADDPTSPGSNIYGSLDTVFDILIPLQSRDVHTQISRENCGGDTSQSDYDSDIDKRYSKNKFHQCKSCGRIAENCECTGCGDFEEFSTFFDNEECKQRDYETDDIGFEYEQIDAFSDKSNTKSSANYGSNSLMQNVTPSTSKDLYSGGNDSESEDIFGIKPDGLDSLSKQNLFDGESDSELLDQVDEGEETTMYETQPDDEVLEDLPQIQSSSLRFPGYSDVFSMRQNKFRHPFQSPFSMEEYLQLEEDALPVLQVPLEVKTARSQEPVEDRQPDKSEEQEVVPSKGPSMEETPGIENSQEHLEEQLLPPPLEAVGSMGDTIRNQPDEMKPVEALLPEGQEVIPLEAAEQHEEFDMIDRELEQRERQDSMVSYIPITDSAVLAELKEADQQAMKTAVLINQMKESIAQFQEKELSEEDSLVLKIKQVELMKKLTEFEDITQRVQRLVGLTDMKSIPSCTSTEELPPSLSYNLPSPPRSLPSSPIPPEPEQEPTSLVSQELVPIAMSPVSSSTEVLDMIPEEEDEECRCKEEDIAKFKKIEDIIPKVIVCGADNRIPRIIVCEPPQKTPPPSNVLKCPPPPVQEVPELMLSLTGRLNESYSMQERLATDNAELENGRYYLQEELLQKDTTVEVLQRRVGSLQTEMRIIAKENSILNEKLTQINQMDCMCGKKPTKVCTKPQKPLASCGVCVDPRLQQYSNTTAQLERQLHQIEGEVKSMQCELLQVQRERQQLEQQRKLLKCTQPPPCAPCCPRSQGGGRDRESPEQAVREMKEQYSRLQDDYKGKVSEVASLRREIEKLKGLCEKSQESQVEAESQYRCVQAQLRNAELEAKKLVGSREHMIEQEQQLNMAKQRYREAQDELEELRGLVQDQSSQLEDYRNKYLQAQQQVEEQRRQIDVMEMDNNRITDQVNLEIQRVKSQFQEKLQELTPLPDILKATQLKLQEAQQMRIMAERNCEEMSRELKDAKDKTAQLAKELDDYRNNQQLGADERDSMQAKIDLWEKKYTELKEETSRIRAELARMEEIACQNQRRLEEKMHEAAQLAGQLDTVREESARQVARTKDRSETVRRSLQSQISDLERQLAQSRASARAAQKDRDEIRQRMQCQINNLNESFDQAQMRIRSLQSHVNFLKTSYTNIFESGNLMVTECPAQSNYGLDSCDCNF